MLWELVGFLLLKHIGKITVLGWQGGGRFGLGFGCVECVARKDGSQHVAGAGELEGTCGPIDVGVVQFEPFETKDYISVGARKDVEDDCFGVIAEGERNRN